MVFGNGSANLGRNIYTVRPDGSGLHQVTHSDRANPTRLRIGVAHPLS